ncbi:hypothetical protein EUGRSUZ_E00384 [Eucalyptus grandis]|uniref:Uncharacterized protein n=2 Tax=Eucalyptus grandis TaxID=71139 RepID=A0ACC3KRN0_EUCGR|nr:hypothetical protein EUGRSUZ_E00384 [Eucalyptus grandis]
MFSKETLVPTSLSPKKEKMSTAELLNIEPLDLFLCTFFFYFHGPLSNLSLSRFCHSSLSFIFVLLWFDQLS